MASVITPQTIVASNFNVAASALGEYNSGTGYTAGQQVKVSFESDGTTPRTPVYEYEAVGATTGNYPPDDDGTNWILIGASNRWKMFDDFVSSQTVNATSIDVTLTASRIDKLYLLRLDAAQVQIICRESDSTLISDETIDLTDSVSASWSEYFFGDFEFKDTLIYDINGYYTNMTIQIIISKTSGNVACGNCIIGKDILLGETEFGINLGIQDFSIKDTNDFGETTFVERSFAKRMDADIIITHDDDAAEYDRVVRILSNLRATPCVWDFNNEGSQRESFVVYGFVKDWTQIARILTMSQLNIEIEGLT